MASTRPTFDQYQGGGANPARPGMSAAVEAAQAALMARRAAAGIVTRPAGLDPLPGRGALLPAAENRKVGRVEHDPRAALAGVDATVYPRLAGVILQAGQAAAGRLWLLILASEPTRGGAYDLDQVYKTFAGGGSAWRIGGRRRIQQIIKAGAGIFWTIDRGRLWRHGPARVAAALELAHGVGSPVYVPVTDLLGGMHSVRAALFAAALTAHDDPIKQELLQDLTGACPNTQRAYCETAGVEARRQIRILGAADQGALHDAHWQHGPSVFVFIDHDGRQGLGAGAHLLAKSDPNVYTAALSAARRGRTRKINRRLDLVTNGARGNGQAVDYRRFYFQDAAAAGSAFNRGMGRRDCAYRVGQSAAGADFWHTFEALPEGWA